MTARRPYGQVLDATTSGYVGTQGDSPTTEEFIPTSAAGARTIIGKDNAAYKVSDLTVSPRASKQIIWSSELHTNQLNLKVPALTATQKKTTGTFTTNYSLATTQTGNTTLPTGVVNTATSLDVSAFKYLTFVVTVSALSGTSIQFELDMVDDSGTPNVFALAKPAALTAAGGYYISVGPGVSSVAATPPTGFGAFSGSASYTFIPVPLTFLPQVNIAWTATALTSVSWTAFLYGTF